MGRVRIVWKPGLLWHMTKMEILILIEIKIKKVEIEIERAKWRWRRLVR